MDFGIILFFSIFSVVYGMLNSIVLLSYAGFFGLHIGYIFWGIILLLTVSFILSSLAISNSRNILLRLYYWISTSWMGFVFINFCIIIVYDIVNLVHPITYQYTGWIILCMAIIVSAYAIFNASIIHVNKIIIKSAKIEKPLRIVQLSDLHLGAIYGRSHTKKIAFIVDSLNPDVVLITGDLIDGKYDYDKATFLEFNKITVETYMTIGNHERYAGMYLTRSVIAGTKIKLLQNSTVSTHGINIIGIDDSDDRNQISKALAHIDIDDSKYNLLMYHRPNGFMYASNKVDFMLAGHTHAGQIWPFTYASKMACDGAVNGLYKVHGRDFLYVSPGTGTWGPKMRLGSRNEVTLILLMPEKT